MGWELVTVEFFWVYVSSPGDCPNWRLSAQNASISPLAMHLSTNMGAAPYTGLQSYFQAIQPWAWCIVSAQ